MQNVELTIEEEDTLTELLRHYIQELDIEVGRTDTHDFKEKLKHRRQVLERVLAKLASQPITA
jgi:hypothetical protein